MSWQTPKKDWTRADGVRNTDLNRIEGNVEHVYDNLGNLRRQVDEALYLYSQRLAIEDLDIGAEFALYEHDVLVPYLKINANYEGTGRALVVRKGSYMAARLQEGSFGYYEGCWADTFLNYTYFGYLDDATRSVITDTNIDVAAFTGVNTISRKIFLLSRTEYNFSGGTVEGDINYYFSNPERRIATMDGIAYEHWTRSVLYSDSEAVYVTSTGAMSTGSPIHFLAGIRPAFTLPQHFQVIAKVPATANTVATAEVLEQ